MRAKNSKTEALLSALRSGEKLSPRAEIELVVRLALPAILAQISVVLMQYIDAAMVGHLGAQESAAIGLVSSTIWLFWGITGASCMGFSVQAAHRIGAQDFTAAKSLLRQAFTCVTALSSFMALLGVAIHTKLPYWLGGDPAIASDASAYFVILTATLPLVLMSWLAGAFLRAAGDMKTPSFLGILMCVLDVIFNALLIFPTREVSIYGFNFIMPGAGLGIEGAAWGSVIADAIVAVMLLWVVIVRSPILKLVGTTGSFIPSYQTVKRAVTIAMPVGCERILMSGAQILSTMIVAPLGIVAVASHSLAITAESLCYMPGYGIGEAATTLVGQSIGAKRESLAQRLAKRSVAFGMAVMTVMGVVLYASAPALMRMMTNVPEVIALGTEVLRIEAWAEPMFAAAIVCHGVFVGAGDTLIPALMNLSCIWGVRLTAAFFLAPIWGLAGVWIAMCGELIVRGCVFLWRLKGKSWITRGQKALNGR